MGSPSSVGELILSESQLILLILRTTAATSTPELLFAIVLRHRQLDAPWCLQFLTMVAQRASRPLGRMLR